MFELKIHKSAQKAFQKAPKRIQEKIFICLKHFGQKGLEKPPYPIKTLQGRFKKYKYLEVKIDKDYRIIFRLKDNTFYIRSAGTHNTLGTG